MIDDLATIKRLREETGVGVMDVKRALEASGGNITKARESLRGYHAVAGAKKSGRDMTQGLIEAYCHLGRIGAMIEVSCETDFVARTADFKAFVHDLALHVAAMNPGDLDELLAQPVFNDESLTVERLVAGMIGKMGENIQIQRFARFALGEE